MSGQYYSKNNFYIISNRDYLQDYGNQKSERIDMTLSGTYLSKYPLNFKNALKELDKYPNIIEKEKLINNIRKKFAFYDENYKIVFGAGSNGIIQNVCKILLKPNTNLVTSYLTFSQVEYAATSFGAVTKRVFLKDNKIVLANFEQAIDENTKLVYICNPNNPTGFVISNDEIIEFAKKYPNVYFLVDESNIEFSNVDTILKKNIISNLLVLKSFSKAYGLANLRIGYMICNLEFYRNYQKNITINEFSGISIICANRAICSDLYKDNVKKIKQELEYLRKELKSLGIQTYETQSNTLFTETVFEKNFLDILKKNNISVVPIYDQDEKLHIRIACQKHKTNMEFIKILRNIKNEGEYLWRN